MDIHVTIPIRPHLKKFMRFFTGVEPYRISNKDPFGRVILAELKKPSIHYHTFKKKKQFIYLSESLEVVIPFDLWQRRYRFVVSEDTVKNIDCFLHNLFKANFRTTIHFHELVKTKKKRAKFRAYMNLFNIEEDEFDIDTLKKDFYRFAKKMTGKNVPLLTDKN